MSYTNFIISNITKFILKPHKYINIIRRYKNVGINVLLSSGYVIEKSKIAVETEEMKLIDVVSENFSKTIQDACKSSETKVNELIQCVGNSIQITCEDYRKCLIRQIEILNRGIMLDPLSEYWDELVKCRVEATALKKEFEKYQSLIEYIGQLSHNLNTCYMLLDKPFEVIDNVHSEFLELRKLNEEQNVLNRTLEKKLIELDTLVILNTPVK